MKYWISRLKTWHPRSCQRRNSLRKSPSSFDSYQSLSNGTIESLFGLDESVHERLVADDDLCEWEVP